MISIFILFLVVCSGGVFGVFTLKKRFSEMLPLSCAGIILIMFVFGLAGALNAGMYAVMILAAILYVYSFLFALKKHELKNSLLRFIQADTAVFVLAAILFALADFKMRVIVIDDFTHWTDIVRSMTLVNDLGTNPAANVLWPAYPPGVSLFEYLAVRPGLVSGPGIEFPEWQVLYGLHILTTCMIMPLFHRIRYKKPLGLIIAIVAVLTLPAVIIQRFYYSTLIDSFLGMMSGIGPAYLLIYHRDRIMKVLAVSSAALILVLSKDTGLVFAILLCIAIVIDELFIPAKKEAAEKKSPSNSVRRYSRSREWYLRILSCISVILCTFVPKILWSMHLAARSMETDTGNPFDPGLLGKLFLGQAGGWQQENWNGYFAKLFSDKMKIGWIGLELSYFLWFVITLCVLAGLIILTRCFARKYFRISVIVSAVLVFQMIVYVIGLEVTYIFHFTYYEAIRYASFDRYVMTAFIGSLFTVFTLVIQLLYESDRWGTAVSAATLIGLLLIAPMANTPGYLIRGDAHFTDETREEIDRLSTEAVLRIQEIEDRKTEDAVDEKSNLTPAVYYVSEDDENLWLEYLAFRMDVRPLRVQWGNWVLSTEAYGEPQVKCLVINADDWMKLLTEEYDYVYIYRADKKFIEEYGDLFADPDSISSGLYFIDKDIEKLIYAERRQGEE